MDASTGKGTGSPCGACKFLRRKCAADCIFAPYFGSEQGPATFAAIHKVFGASNASKLLVHVPVPDRCEAVLTIAYEAQARLTDPVYGCVARIFALQQQVAYLQAQVMEMKAQLAQNYMIAQSTRITRPETNQWPSMVTGLTKPSPCTNLPLDSINATQDSNERVFSSFQVPYSKKRPPQTELSELQQLALRMIKNQN